MLVLLEEWELWYWKPFLFKPKMSIRFSLGRRARSICGDLAKCQLLTGQRYEPGKVPGKLDLPAGVYLLKTYNQAYQDMSGWLDTEKGNMAFSAEKDFEIESNEINYLSVEVPMVNIGVSLKLPEGFSDRFKDYHFTVQVGNRSVEISNGETAYFPLSEVTYILSATNNDGENKTKSKTIKSPVAGTIYEISYGYATKGLIISAKYGL